MQTLLDFVIFWTPIASPGVLVTWYMVRRDNARLSASREANALRYRRPVETRSMESF